MSKDVRVAVRDDVGKRTSEGKLSWRKLSDVFPSMFKSKPGVAGTGVLCVAKGVYDFASMGGAAATTFNLLPNNELIPVGAVILRSFTQCITQCTGGASVSFGINSAVDLKAATAVTTWGSANTIVDGAAAVTEAGVTPTIVTTAPSQITMTTSVSTITAGKIAIFVEYIVSE